MMAFIIGGAWRLTQALNFGGIAVAVIGVAVFGWTFVKLNALAARGESNSVPSASWRGPSARLGMLIFACGVGMQLLGYVMAVLLPHRM
jgi:hypothetical protein